MRDSHIMNTQPWPKCTVLMRDGSSQSGDVAYVGGAHTTVRFSVAAKLMPGPQGQQFVDFSYRDIPNEYVTIASDT